MNTNLIAGFLLLAIPAFFTPGPNNLMLMTSAAAFGPRRTVPHGLGIIIGFPVMVFAVSLGFGAVLTAVPQARTVLKYAAAVYFLWMAWHLLGLKIGDVGGRKRPMTLIEGALFQWINPKAWAMATSFAAAFVLPGDGRMASIFWLTLGCLAMAPLSTVTWVVFGHQLFRTLQRTGTEHLLGGILAALMVGAVILFVL